MQTQTPTSQIQSENYRFLQQHVYSQVGIVLGDDKHYLFDSRLSPIVRQLGLGTINDLCALLRAGRETAVARQVVEAMTTNETYFFRDPGHYEAMRTILLPRLRQERQDTRKLRFWSAAASTGQEAYSLALLLHQEGFADWNVQILGTDYSSQVLERARSGLYQQIEVNRGLPAAVLVKYFHRCGLDWQLAEKILRMAYFQTADLRAGTHAFGPFDLVLCRNVMIYFDVETRLNLLRQIHGTLFRGGWLLLGGTEAASGYEEWFEKQNLGSTVVYVAR